MFVECDLGPAGKSPRAGFIEPEVEYCNSHTGEAKADATPPPPGPPILT